MNDCDRYSIGMSVLEDFFDLLAEFVDGLRGFRFFLFFVSGQTEWNEQKEKNSRDSPFHVAILREERISSIMCQTCYDGSVGKSMKAMELARSREIVVVISQVAPITPS